MADDQHELRSVNWAEMFAFTHIFKSWQMAIHPSKLILALAAILVVYGAGRLMDGIWGAAGRRVVGDEIAGYVVVGPRQLAQQKQTWNQTRASRVASLAIEARSEQRSLGQFSSRLPSGPLASKFRDLLSQSNTQRSSEVGPTLDQLRTQAQEDWADVLEQAQDSFDDETERASELLDDAHEQAADQIKQQPAEQRGTAREQLDDDHDQARAALADRKVQFGRDIDAIRGKGIFQALLDWERACVREGTSAVVRGDFLSGLRVLLSRSADGMADLAPQQQLPVPSAQPERPGALYFLALGLCGLCWLISQHWLYAVIFLAIALLAWSLLGGAVYRIAALHAARDEKISIVAALRYSAGKLLSFFSAPLIPLAIILVLGLLLALGGLLGNIPWGIGALIIGAGFFLAILLGLLIAFLAIGLTAGFGLMYPTITVEGSDCFDAISRSFSYVFSRPWRTILYSLVALVYGTLCYLFVRLFAFLALMAARTFVGWGVFTGGRNVPEGADRLDALWPTPTFDNFHGPVNWAALSGAEALGALLLAIWVYLVAAVVAAFLLSFYASAGTMIYLLLRRHVDATELNDVWVEESAEQAEQAAGEAAPPPPSAPPSAPPAEPNPPSAV